MLKFQDRKVETKNQNFNFVMDWPPDCQKLSSKVVISIWLVNLNFVLLVSIS